MSYDRGMNQGERIASVEVRLYELEKKFDAMDAKIDKLLDLRSKGAGAFWLATALLGTGIVGFFTKFFPFLGGR
jgi:hypothetical protein